MQQQQDGGLGAMRGLQALPRATDGHPDLIEQRVGGDRLYH
jgi:hypothetical protein